MIETFREEAARTREECIAEVARIMRVRAMGPVPLACVRTYGCQQNVADGEKSRASSSRWAFRSPMTKRRPT